jgi:pilus assembly protein CpaF
MEGNAPLMQDLFVFRRQGRQGRRIAGVFTATGVVPRLAEELREQGVAVAPALFQRTDGAS